MRLRRATIRITGIVQGIGFRPFIYNLAKRREIRGWVLNNEQGVFIEAESGDGNLERFIRDIPALAPALARIETFEVNYLPPVGYSDFEIRQSEEAPEKFTLISPDLATCEACLAELFSPENVRFRYPFINCTLCGPRFTIIQDIPYDRHKTTMTAFVMCPSCQKEYEDPSDRRFHAQPNACPSCGPRIELRDRQGHQLPGDPIETALDLLEKGAILAVKGIGGFHLACDATNEEAVSTLRSRKFREDKPFALMCRDLEEVKRYCEVDPEEERLLKGTERPIVILKRKRNIPIAPSVAPYQNTLGVMLPYSPLHHLLLRGNLRTLVMTSGNKSEEPIAYKNEEAINRLREIADFFLLHDREIHIRCDDSVLRVFGKRPYFLRRSRGYVPFPIKLPFSLEMILACGGELKNTFCLTRGPYAFLSHHIGDLENLETLSSFEEGIEHFKRLFNIEPKAVAYDLHPDYLSTKYALAIPDLPKVGVQHHHAHIVSCMAENGIEGEVIGVAFDGTGFGTDGTIWGGEFLKVSPKEFKRLAHLKKVPLPGGSKAIRQPWRMAMVYLSEAFGQEWASLKIDLMDRVDLGKWAILQEAIHKKVNTPLTSSMGRFFDAIASLLSVRDEVNYEGQAAIELESMADQEVEEDYPFHLLGEERPFVIDPSPVIRGVVADLTEGISPSKISGKFHRTVGRMIVETCKALRAQEGLHRVVLSGGVFQNIFLLSLTTEALKKEGFETFLHHQVPANDGGLSLGQAVIAQARLFSCV
ncbi:MAG: carbamoyltransferase HypF [Desulfobacterota bacterium]|nr:carbamoyltransferase HypF [Thermodesulfobacteriota bacterium]